MKGNNDCFSELLGEQTVERFKIPVVKRLFAPFDRMQLLAMPPMQKAQAILEKMYEKESSYIQKQKIGHVIRVSRCVDTPDEKMVALFHEGIEDERVTLEELQDLNFSEEGIKALSILTSDEDKYPEYEDYIRQLIASENLIALKVKFWSLMDKNFQIQNNEDLNTKEKRRIISKRNFYIFEISEAIQKIEVMELEQQLVQLEKQVIERKRRIL